MTAHTAHPKKRTAHRKTVEFLQIFPEIFTDNC